MSTAQTAPAVQPASEDQAYQFLYERIHAPAFFNKLASDFNIRPRNSEEADEMLKVAGKLRLLYDNNGQAAPEQVLLKHANAELDAELAKRGLATPPAAQAIKVASVELARDPNIASAILTMLAAQREAAAA